MSILSENFSIKIRDVQKLTLGRVSTHVAARPYHALAFRLRGGAAFTGGNGQSASTHTGDVFYMPARLAYTAAYTEENEILVVHFDSDLNAPMENFQLVRAQSCTFLFQKLLNIWHTKADGYYYAALSVFGELLEDLALQKAPPLLTETVKAFEAAIRYMEKHLTSPALSVEALVKKAHMSNTYFRRLFYARFAATPAKYITAQRLVLAEKLLASGTYSVKEVAERVGFGDEKYFSRIVKKEYGVPPSKLYRPI